MSKANILQQKPYISAKQTLSTLVNSIHTHSINMAMNMLYICCSLSTKTHYP